MKLLVLSIVLAITLAGNVQVDPQPQPQPQVNTTAPPSTTTPTPTTTNATTTSTTTTTTTTTPPSTTTKPTVPTTKSTTTTTPPPTTPTTTTTPKPTPSPSPAPPVPPPAPGSWSLNYTKTNNSCIMIEVAAQFEIIANNKTAKVNVPKGAIASGNCSSNGTQSITLSWKGAAKDNNTVILTFKLNNSKFDLEEISSFMNLSQPQGFQVFKLNHTKPEFSTPVAYSYKCDKVQTLNLTDAATNATVAYVHISDVRFQAFANSSTHAFAEAKDCQSSVTPDVVPIVVGCVLAVLVVMVLIAYLIGRRRCQARGYLSM